MARHVTSMLTPRRTALRNIGDNETLVAIRNDREVLFIASYPTNGIGISRLSYATCEGG